MQASPKPKREWVTVPAASVRRLVVFSLIVAAAIGGYRIWQRAYLERQATEILQDANTLAEDVELPPEAAGMLGEARAAHDRGEWTLAVQHAQRFIAFVNTNVELRGAVRVLRVEGSVESRRGDSQSWQRVRSGVRLKFGTWVKTDAGGSAELLFPGDAVLRLRPEAMMRLEDKAALFQGGVEVDTNTREQIVETVGAQTRLKRDSSVNISVDDGGDSKVAVIEGEAQVTTETGDTRLLGRLQQVVKTGETLSEVEVVLAGPELTTPDDWQIVDPAEVEEIVLGWQPVAGARAYRLQVSAGPLFATNLIDDERSGTSARLGANDEGSFHWRVAAVDRKGSRGSWSYIRRFQVRTLSGDPLAPPPEPPQLQLDKLVLAGNMVIVTGRTDPQAVVTVQGRRLYVPLSGRFRTTVELRSEGKHTLRVVATNESGGQAVETREIDFVAVY